MTRRSLSLAAALLAGYLLLAILHTYPLAWRLGSHLPGLGLGDNVSFVWNGWWMREALASSTSDFFAKAPIEAPLFPSLVLHTHSALAAFLGATVFASLSVVAAQNVLLIASLALNGLAAYTLAWTVSGARKPSILAGALFVLAPSVTARLMGHYNLVMVWPLAFACAAYIVWWRWPSITTAIVMAIASALIPYADYYYAVFFAVFALAYGVSEIWSADLRVTRRGHTRASLLLTALALLAYLAGITIALLPPRVWHIGSIAISISTPTNALTIGWLLLLAALVLQWRPRLRISRRPSPGRSFVRSLPIALLLFVVLLTPLLVPALSFLSSGDYVTQSSSLRSGPRGVDLATLVLGPPFHGGLGPAVRDLYARLGIDVMEASAWIGVGLMLLFAISVHGAERTRELRRWIGVSAMFGIWALGPFLIALARNTGILLPQAVAHFIPIVNNARIPGRAMAMVTLALLVVLSLALSRRKHALLPFLVQMLCGLAIVESLAAPLPLAAMPSTGVYADIAADTGSGAVLTIPFGVRDGFGEKGQLEHESLYGQTIHRHPLVGGFLARLPPRVWSWYEQTEPYRTLLALSAGDASASLPSCEQVAAGLRAASVAFLVLHPAEMSPPLTELVARMPLRPMSRDDQRLLFAVDATRSAPCGPAAQ